MNQQNIHMQALQKRLHTHETINLEKKPTTARTICFCNELKCCLQTHSK